MISFKRNKARFNYRSAAVIVHDGHVLIHRAEDDDFWALPGGRVEFMEYADATVTREILEELGLDSKIVRQLWHVENFFEYNSEKYHEISNYYLVSLDEPPAIDSEVDFNGIEHTDNIIFRWVPLARSAKYNLKPGFLVRRLSDLPSKTDFIKVDELSA